MKYDPAKHHRRSIRLKDYDYSQAGAYFVTIVIRHHECLLGNVVDGEMRVNGFGKMVQKCWDELSVHYSNVELDAFVVMPNHVHGIVVIVDRRGEVTSPLQLHDQPTLGRIIGYFKYQSTKLINELRGTPGAPVWQRNYFEHIIRNDHDFERIREYIAYNPIGWQMDDENPNHA